MSIQQFNLGTGDIVSIVSNTTTNLDISAVFGDNYSRPRNKTIVIEAGVIVGSNSTASAALIVPAGGMGIIKIINFGSIQGAGGSAGTSGPGGTGGDAILIQSSTLIINQTGASIYAGGGGGGKGGVGGQGGNGQYGQSLGASGCYAKSNTCTQVCQLTYGAGAYGTGSLIACNLPTHYCTSCATTVTTSGGAGGAGGNGGKGQGYDGAFANGSSGSAGFSGGVNAGTGGTGGAGGSGGNWGASGNNGVTGATGSNGNLSNGLTGIAGSDGGLAGYYINGYSSYTTFVNSGTAAGRTN